jgi:hypothetical protein
MRHLRQVVVRGARVHQNHLDVVRHLVEIYKDRNLADVNLVHLVLEKIVLAKIVLVDLRRVDQFSDQVAVVAQQNRDEPNLDVVQTLVLFVHQVVLLAVQLAVAVLDHQKFRMDYFLVVAVDVVRVVAVKVFVVKVFAVKVWEPMVLELWKFRMDYFRHEQQEALVESQLQRDLIVRLELQEVRPEH